MHNTNPKYYRLAWLFTLAIIVSAVTLVGAVTNLVQAINVRQQMAALERAQLIKARPTGAVTASTNITVSSPRPNQVISSPLIISGTARTFEGTVNYRLKNSVGEIIKEGNTIAASPEMGQFGPYSAALKFNTPVYTIIGTLEVFQYSAKDGTPIDMVIIPIMFSPVVN